MNANNQTHVAKHFKGLCGANLVYHSDGKFTFEKTIKKDFVVKYNAL